MGNYAAPWKKYATFSGRATRAEYWTFTLINVVIYAVLFGISSASDSMRGVGLGLYIVFAVATIVPSLAVLVRRLHDTDRSGAWFFISFVPFIGGLWLLVLTLLGGTPGPNKYGQPNA